MLRNIFSAASLVAILVVLVAGNVLAQTNASASVSASATVLTALTITKNTDVAFGNIGATTAGIVYIDPKGVANNYVGTGWAVGTLTVAGAISQNIRLTWPVSIPLTSGANSMTYTLKVNTLNANTQASSTTKTLTSGYFDDATNVTGGYFLWVGGDLGQLAGQATGAYTGTAPFTVEYN